MLSGAQVLDVQSRYRYSYSLSRKASGRNPRGILPNKFPGGLCRGFFGGFFGCLFLWEPVDPVVADPVRQENDKRNNIQIYTEILY